MSNPLFCIIFFLLLRLLALAKAEPDATIRVNSVIIASKSDQAAAAWFSPSRSFAFGFYNVSDEFAVGIWFVAKFTVIWTAHRDDGLFPEGSKLCLAENGLQILSTKGDRPIANISANSKLMSAFMQDCGNFIISDVSNRIIWQTFDNPTDTLMAGQLLFAGKNLVSGVSATDHSSGRFQIVVQEDGNVGMCPMNIPDISAQFCWTSNTSGNGYTGIYLDEYGGVLRLNRNPNTPHNCTPSSPSIYFSRMEPDGFMRTYLTNGSYAELASQLPPLVVDQCSIKGACGPNSYCNFTAAAAGGAASGVNASTLLVQGEATCLCFPGFDYADRSKPFMGCRRNFSVGHCVAENNTLYSMARLSNMYWSDDPYNDTDDSTEADCHDSCLKDCNCFAALFFANQRCSKQRHPLLYGRSMESVVALLKVGSGETQLPPPQQPPREVVNGVPGGKMLLLSVALASVLVISLTLTVFLFYTNRDPSYRKLCRNMETGLAGGLAPRSFTYQQLVEATDNFTKRLGSGSFSTVFRGEIPLSNGEVMPIAVKRLDKKLSTVNEKGFRTEMRAVGRAHHRNVVRLLGFCHEGPKWLLIYEYMSRGSLAHLIFPAAGSGGAPPSWKERAGIAMDVARGLLYLHEGCEATIIHSDIKPENVLVGEDGTAKIGDLGLAKLLQPWQSKAYADPRGTLLYRAPEWTKDAGDPVSSKADVYSFGILLLELITRRSKTMAEPVNGCFMLSQWAYKCLMESTLEQLVLDGEDVDKEELKKMVMVALWCVQQAPAQRKSMKEVVRMLGGKTTIPMPPDSII